MIQTPDPERYLLIVENLDVFAKMKPRIEFSRTLFWTFVYGSIAISWIASTFSSVD